MIAAHPVARGTFCHETNGWVLLNVHPNERVFTIHTYGLAVDVAEYPCTALCGTGVALQNVERFCLEYELTHLQSREGLAD